MKLLLDTHALVWHFLDSPRLPERLKELIDDPDVDVFVSAASAWEIATKVRIGRFADAEELSNHLPQYLHEYRFSQLPITIEHGHSAGLLPGDHKDPFDRMLAAQAILEGLTIVSVDPALKAFGASVLWSEQAPPHRGEAKQI